MAVSHSLPAIALASLLALLAGCAGPEPGPSGPAAPGVPAEAGADTTIGHQRETLSWLASGIACAHAGATQETIYATLLPELEGITYAAAAVDPATIGQEWTASAAHALSMVGFEVTFWRGAVGPGGEALEMRTSLPPLEGDATVEGKVPEGADFVSVFACSGEPGTVGYAAAIAPERVDLL